MNRCQICGHQTANRTTKKYKLVLCANCRVAQDEAERRNAEWQAQTGNPNYQWKRKKRSKQHD